MAGEAGGFCRYVKRPHGDLLVWNHLSSPRSGKRRGGGGQRIWYMDRKMGFSGVVGLNSSGGGITPRTVCMYREFNGVYPVILIPSGWDKSHPPTYEFQCGRRSCAGLPPGGTKKTVGREACRIER